jgi:hypothetical protein
MRNVNSKIVGSHSTIINNENGTVIFEADQSSSHPLLNAERTWSSRFPVKPIWVQITAFITAVVGLVKTALLLVPYVRAFYLAFVHKRLILPRANIIENHSLFIGLGIFIIGLLIWAFTSWFLRDLPKKIMWFWIEKDGAGYARFVSYRAKCNKCVSEARVEGDGANNIELVCKRNPNHRMKFDFTELEELE